MLPCFTFYSYKGGSGRSTTLLNTIRYLIKDLKADAEHPILVVDADLESAGLTYFFGYHNRFNGTLNAGNVLREINAIVTSGEEKVIFGVKDELKDDRMYMTCSSHNETWELLKQLDARDSTAGDKISEVFRDLRLPAKYFMSLADVAKDHLSDVYSSDERDIWRLKDALKKIRASDLPQKEKDEKMTKMVIDFLPARTFLDITSSFDRDGSLQPNTVRFLGTDVSAEARVESGDAASSIEVLRDKCRKYGYSAIIFDSGSGTQSSAYVLHATSDVIVYCMRPTMQFIEGTKDVLFKYNQLLQENSKLDSEKKNIILFPNAVPESDDSRLLCEDSFKKIADIARVHSDLIDDTFCTEETCLHEVPLFKWRETILGCFRADPRSKDAKVEKIVERFSQDPAATEPFDKVYRKLSERLVYNA